MAELKEFAGELKELPHITRHIGLAEELSRRCAQQRFRDRIAAEQSLLDGVALDATCESIEVGMHQDRQRTACQSNARRRLLSKAMLFCGVSDLGLLKISFGCRSVCL